MFVVVKKQISLFILKSSFKKYPKHTYTAICCWSMVSQFFSSYDNSERSSVQIFG